MPVAQVGCVGSPASVPAPVLSPVATTPETAGVVKALALAKLSLAGIASAGRGPRPLPAEKIPARPRAASNRHLFIFAPRSARILLRASLMHLSVTLSTGRARFLKS